MFSADDYFVEFEQVYIYLFPYKNLMFDHWSNLIISYLFLMIA